MTGAKHWSRYRKKRKGKGFLGIPPHAKSVEESVLKDDEILEDGYRLIDLKNLSSVLSNIHSCQQEGEETNITCLV